MSTEVLQLVRYSPSQQPAWDQFVAKARNGLFMFQRPFMDYHANYFTDHSLLLYRNQKLVGLLPANQQSTTIYSHQGLTYGGLIVDEKAGAELTLSLLEQVQDYYSKLGFTQLVYKVVPHIFTNYPCQEDQYALFRLGAQLSQVELSSCILLSAENIPKRQYLKRKYRQAQAQACYWQETEGAEAFWPLLEQLLSQKHETTPTHSLREISYLKAAFPRQIRFYMSYSKAGELLAGVVLFLFGNTAHVQYCANSPEGHRLNALTYLFTELIALFRQQGYRYFNFGISNEEGGRILNSSLSFYKESFGGRGVALPRYTLALTP